MSIPIVLILSKIAYSERNIVCSELMIEILKNVLDPNKT